MKDILRDLDQIQWFVTELERICKEEWTNPGVHSYDDDDVYKWVNKASEYIWKLYSAAQYQHNNKYDNNKLLLFTYIFMSTFLLFFITVVLVIVLSLATQLATCWQCIWITVILVLFFYSRKDAHVIQ